LAQGAGPVISDQDIRNDAVRFGGRASCVDQCRTP